MPFFNHPATRVMLPSLGLFAMMGCQSFTTTSNPRLRIIDLSADAGALDIYQGGRAVAFNLAYGTVTSYVDVGPGAVSTVVASAGSKQTLSLTKTTLLPGSLHTVLVSGSLADLHQTVLTDEAPKGGPALRFVHQAERAGAVDVYLVPAGRWLAGLAPIVTNLTPGITTAYLTATTGICTVIVLPAGTRSSAGALALHTGHQIEYLHGSARTLILLDAPPTQTRTLDVIETSDAESAN